jgi:hypothetical protein
MMPSAVVERYVVARRDLIALWCAKRRLLNAAKARFPKSHPVFKALQRVCHKDPTCAIRFLADKSACKCADRYGDELFRREVDGVAIPVVTQWFYGLSLPDEVRRIDRTKAFNLADAYLLDEVCKRARSFVQSVSTLLPFVPKMELAREEKKFDKLFASAQAYVQKCSPVYTAYLCLLRRLPHDLAHKIVFFCE